MHPLTPTVLVTNQTNVLITLSQLVASSFEYVWGDLYHAEDLALYQPDGFHPVYLGDLYDTRRYKVLHKLGHDSFSTTWLVRDQRLDSYVALKVIAVDASGNNCKDL